jgi:putative restriction endonuclease
MSTNAIKIYVGVTDLDWFEFLSRRQDVDEVNFWQPGGRSQFRALQPGELFLFKLHSPNNFIVGGGLFGHASIVPISLAWEAFGVMNGAESLEEMRRRVARYRREPVEYRTDYSIGCRILEQPFFWPRELWIPIADRWAPSIVVGKSFDTGHADGRFLWDAVRERLAARSAAAPSPLDEVARYSTPRLVKPRLGQGTFRVAVTDSYDRRCAITGERTLPVLDAAHIRAYGAGGEHEVSNGLLLRTDIHKLFDRGYVTVDPDFRFVVSPRLREDFQNGKHYYDLAGQDLRLPVQQRLRPDPEALDWHRQERFLG